MPPSIPPSTADVYLLCTTPLEPPMFIPCTPQNAHNLRYSIQVHNAEADLTIPLPLHGLKPTDGPVIRLLLAFLSSRAFERFHVSPTAHATIRTILSALWAIWSDLDGIKTTAYMRFCQGLQDLMPVTQPHGGDMTDQMQDFLVLMAAEVGRAALKYRRIEDPEIRDAVQQLHRRRIVRMVGVTADPENGDSGEETHEYATVAMKYRVKGSNKLLRHQYFFPPGAERTAVE